MRRLKKGMLVTAKFPSGKIIKTKIFSIVNCRTIIYVEDSYLTFDLSKIRRRKN